MIIIIIIMYIIKKSSLYSVDRGEPPYINSMRSGGPFDSSSLARLPAKIL